MLAICRNEIKKGPQSKAEPSVLFFYLHATKVFDIFRKQYQTNA